MCPLIIGMDVGGYLDRVKSVNPGKCGRYPRRSAVPSVLSDGEKSVACENATSSDGEAEESDARQCSLLVGGRACVANAGNAMGDGVSGDTHLKLISVFFGGSEGVGSALCAL
jgi:hypothetical protein